ncbi:hypothetical protein NECAME_08207 [Necator americanus]|uniref:Uncharacterized protein n=1 Tax=Necator americanus TaxID=51031 RepID=W2TKA3_NECAM|nr:hypothetical protein NECAME_08207 [Necator americanus]ETN82054.1 hypothetical protein NECAME_08207 [Necator americanus]
MEKTLAAKDFNNLSHHTCEALRREKPDVFEILSKYSLEFIEEGYDIHDGPDSTPKKFEYNMCARHRTIKWVFFFILLMRLNCSTSFRTDVVRTHRLDEKGRVIKIQFGNAMRSWFYDCNPERIQDIYR